MGTLRLFTNSMPEFFDDGPTRPPHGQYPRVARPGEGMIPEARRARVLLFFVVCSRPAKNRDRRVNFRGYGTSISCDTPTLPIIMAYISKDSEESFPDRDFSISQLLHAAKRKLQNAMLGGRYAYTALATLLVTQALFLQNCDNSEPGRGRVPEIDDTSRELTQIFIFRSPHWSGTRWTCSVCCSP